MSIHTKIGGTYFSGEGQFAVLLPLLEMRTLTHPLDKSLIIFCSLATSS